MVYAIVFLLLVLLDQGTKAAAFALVDVNEPVRYWLGKVFGIDRLINKGMSFGIGSDTPWALALFIALTSVAIVVLLAFIIKLNKKRRFLKTALVLIMAGAAGNLIDRCILGGVRDLIYMDFRFIINSDYLCFSNNIADIVITVGAVMFVLALLFVDSDAIFRAHKDKQEEKQEVETAAEDLIKRAVGSDNESGTIPQEKKGKRSDKDNE